jgi:hypothetical protein
MKTPIARLASFLMFMPVFTLLVGAVMVPAGPPWG